MMLQYGLFFCYPFFSKFVSLQAASFPFKNLTLHFPRFLLIPIFIIGGGFYAIPYQIALETMDLMTAVCGVFIAAFFFSIPGAWIHRENFELGKKTMLGIVAVAIC